MFPEFAITNYHLFFNSYLLHDILLRGLLLYLNLWKQNQYG
jgi:hypothetical protein